MGFEASYQVPQECQGLDFTGDSPQRNRGQSTVDPLLDAAQKFMVAVAQLVRALGCGPGSRGFESHQPPQRKRSRLWGLFLWEVWWSEKSYGLTPAVEQRASGCTLRLYAAVEQRLRSVRTLFLRMWIPPLACGAAAAARNVRLQRTWRGQLPSATPKNAPFGGVFLSHDHRLVIRRDDKNRVFGQPGFYDPCKGLSEQRDFILTPLPTHSKKKTSFTMMFILLGECDPPNRMNINDRRGI